MLREEFQLDDDFVDRLLPLSGLSLTPAKRNEISRLLSEFRPRSFQLAVTYFAALVYGLVPKQLPLADRDRLRLQHLQRIAWSGNPSGGPPPGGAERKALDRLLMAALTNWSPPGTDVPSSEHAPPTDEAVVALTAIIRNVAAPAIRRVARVLNISREETRLELESAPRLVVAALLFPEFHKDHEDVSRRLRTTGHPSPLPTLANWTANQPLCDFLTASLGALHLPARLNSARHGYLLPYLFPEKLIVAPVLRCTNCGEPLRHQICDSCGDLSSATQARYWLFQTNHAHLILARRCTGPSCSKHAHESSRQSTHHRGILYPGLKTGRCCPRGDDPSHISSRVTESWYPASPIDPGGVIDFTGDDLDARAELQELLRCSSETQFVRRLAKLTGSDKNALNVLGQSGGVDRFRETVKAFLEKDSEGTSSPDRKSTDRPKT